MRARHGGERLFLSEMAKGRGRWRGPLAEVCPSYRAGAAPRQFPLQLGIPAGGGAGRRASPCLSRSSHPPASPLTVNSTLSSQGCPCWQCPASPTGQGELRNKPNRPHCAGCRSAAENSESAPPALNHEIILWVTGVTFCVRGTREPPVPQPWRHHRARGTLLRAPPHKGTSACAKHWEPKPHQANTLPRFCASGGGGGGGNKRLLGTPEFAAVQCITQANPSALEQAVAAQPQAISPGYEIQPCSEFHSLPLQAPERTCPVPWCIRNLGATSSSTFCTSE